MKRHEIGTKQKYLAGSYFLERNWDYLKCQQRLTEQLVEIPLNNDSTPKKHSHGNRAMKIKLKNTEQLKF